MQITATRAATPPSNTILVVDGDPRICDLVESVLGLAGYLSQVVRVPPVRTSV